MDKKQSSPRLLDSHFVDIHEVLPEEEEEEGCSTRMADKADKRFNRPIKGREMKRNHRSFSRQVSLETGFSVLNRESKAKDERRSLPRSGRSFGGFDSANRIGIDGRKEDHFSMFKTKSTLTKQNSLLPHKKEREMESQRTEGSIGGDESVNRSVPAGRYFAALRGPELDQVKVMLQDQMFRFPSSFLGIILMLRMKYSKII